MEHPERFEFQMPTILQCLTTNPPRGHAADKVAAERTRYQTALKRGLEILKADDDSQ